MGGTHDAALRWPLQGEDLDVKESAARIAAVFDRVKMLQQEALQARYTAARALLFPAYQLCWHR